MKVTCGEWRRCEAEDPKVCWALRFPDLYGTLDRNEDCQCPCHKQNVQEVNNAPRD